MGRTVRSLIEGALACTTQEEATAYLDAYRADNPEHADENLGYVFGYVEPPERRAALYALFEGISHPIFGGDALATSRSAGSGDDK